MHHGELVVVLEVDLPAPTLADRPAATPQSSVLCFTHNICIHQETLTLLLVQPWNDDCLLIWGGRTKCKMKHNPVNGALLGLVRLSRFYPPPWSSALLWSLSIYNVATSSSSRTPISIEKHLTKHTQTCLPLISVLPRSLLSACVHNLRRSPLEKKIKCKEANNLNST